MEEVEVAKRRCTRCRLNKPHKEYWRRLNGLFYQCKDCIRQYRASKKALLPKRHVTTADEREKLAKARQRRYYLRHKDRIDRANKRWRENNPNTWLEATRRAKEKHPVRVRARMMVRNAVRNGTLVRQPCVVCGQERTQAHHCDYAKPLAIMWLCKIHHLAWHRMFLAVE